MSLDKQNHNEVKICEKQEQEENLKGNVTTKNTTANCAQKEDSSKDIRTIKKSKRLLKESVESDEYSDNKQTCTNDRQRSYQLDKRQDVLNKTLLRSIKRYLTKQFFSEFDYKNLTPATKANMFSTFLNQFVDKYYKEKAETMCAAYEISLEDIHDYVGIMIHPEFTKKWMKDKKHMKYVKSYYEVVYRYSHKKMSKMFADNILKYIFDDYVTTGAIYEMIDTDQTLSKNKVEYRNTVELFNQSFIAKEYILLDKRY